MDKVSVELKDLHLEDNLTQTASTAIFIRVPPTVSARSNKPT